MASDMMIHCGGGEGNRGMNGFLLLDDFLAAAKAYWGRVGRVGWGGVKAPGNLQFPWAAGLAGPSLATVELMSTPGFPPCLRLGSSQGTWSRSRLCPHEGGTSPLARQES